MKLFILAVVVLALATPLYAESSTPAPATTACGKKAQHCYNSQKGATDELLTQIDIKGACQKYKAMVDCFNTAAADSACKEGNAEFKTFRAAATDEVSGICNDDGTLTDCGYDMRTCVGYVTQVKDIFRDSKNTTICPVIQEIETCTKGVLKSGECPAKYSAALQKAESKFAEADELDNCEGKCGEAAGECTKKFIEVSSVDLKDFNAIEFCTTAYDTIGCINRLKDNTDCKSDSSDVSQAEQLVAGFEEYIKDFCKKDGTPSDCIKELETCTESLKFDAKASTEKKCKGIQEYLECTYGISCFAAIKTKIEAQRAGLESAETAESCPTYGSCTDRLNVCSDKEDKFNALTDKSEKCKLTKEGVSCYHNVRKDPICIKEKAAASSFEKQINDAITKVCDGASFLQLSLMLMVACVLTSLKLFS